MAENIPIKKNGQEKIKAQIREKAFSLGFSAIGFTKAFLPPEIQQDFIEFTGKNCHGSMSWLADKPEIRSQPQNLWPEALSVISVGLNYGQEIPDPQVQEGSDKGYISVYARNRDYHDLIKGRLKHLAQFLVSRFGGNVKVFTDTAPVAEKPLAVQAGLGWQGKHSCVVSREYGSWLFLGEIMSTLPLEPDAPGTDHCGNCRRCLTACPTKAFIAPHKLDARRCISYLTIEHKGLIAEEFHPLIGNRIYGCDDCLAVCPWNRFAKISAEPYFQPRSDLIAPDLIFFAGFDEAAFRNFFSGSPIKRIGYERFLRNVLIALGNGSLKKPELLKRVAAYLPHSSSLIAETAAQIMKRHSALSFSEKK